MEALIHSGAIISIGHKIRYAIAFFKINFNQGVLILLKAIEIIYLKSKMIEALIELPIIKDFEACLLHLSEQDILSNNMHLLMALDRIDIIRAC